MPKMTSPHNNYLATFHSQFGALSLYQDLTDTGIDAELRSVPRSLSSSCGLCVFFKATSWGMCLADDYELEAVYLCKTDEFKVVFTA